MVRRIALALFVLFVALAASWPRVQQLIPDKSEREQVLLTLERIEHNGPFPFARDGVVFQNREHQLPAEPRGYYREYTVPTPGAHNRGARRIIHGKHGETYYTRDHYRSFVRLDR
jgi:ribonuclease T1